MAPTLAELTTLRVGGPARRLVHAGSEEELVDAVRAADAAGEPVLVLGAGSNLLVADSGFPGTVVRVAGAGVQADGDVLRVAAGEPWDPLVGRCVEEGRAGVECLSGIPGTVGATPIQNVGAYGQEVAATVVCVEVHDRRRDELATLSPAQCGFGYRTSALKREPGRWVVLAVSFRLPVTGVSEPVRYAELARRLGVGVGDRAPLAAVRDAVLALRRGKGMVLDAGDHDTWSAGSFFTNPVLSAEQFAALSARSEDAPPGWPEPDGRVKTSAAWLIEHAGFRRGHGDPRRAALSSKHPLALTNRGAASAADLHALAREIAAGVREAFSVELVPEPVLVGLDWP